MNNSNKMDLEVKKSFVEIKAIDDSKNLIVEGYAATFGVQDSSGDIIEKGAFLNTIVGASGKRIRLCYQHDLDDVVGKIIELKEDNIGLYFKAKISNTALGKDLRVLIEDEAITELSIGYKSKVVEWNETEQIRYLKEIELFEISFVSRAANPQAVVLNTEVKREGSKMTNQELIQQFNELKKEIEKRVLLLI